MKNKIAALLLASLLALGSVACSSDGGDDTSTDGGASEAGEVTS